MSYADGWVHSVQMNKCIAHTCDCTKSSQCEGWELLLPDYRSKKTPIPGSKYFLLKEKEEKENSDPSV